MSPERMSFIPNPDSFSYEARLHSLSKEIIPVIHPEDCQTLEEFITPIFEESLAYSRAISEDEMTPSAINKNLLLVVGAPGSGKTHVVNEILKLRQEVGLPDEHFRPFSWEGAEDEVKVEFTEDEKNAKNFSDGRMFQVNNVAMNQVNNSGSWVLGIGEYAPVATKIELGQSLWMGKDAGASFIEQVAQNRSDINVHVIGLCPESRVVRLATPYRTGGASKGNVDDYRRKSTQLALTLHEQRKINLPRYMLDKLRNPDSKVDPFEYEEFSTIFEKPIHEFARFIVDKRYPPHERPRKGIARGFYTKDLRDVFAREIANDDIASYASLYLYNYAFQSELRLPKQNVFLGVTNPDIRKFENAPVDWDNLFIKKMK